MSELNDTTTNSDTALDLAKSNEQIVNSHSAITDDGFNLSALEPAQQLEIVREIIEAESQLEAMALPSRKSSEIVNRPINILDAAFKAIRDGDEEKQCVSFVCEFAEGDDEAGEQFTVLKGSNAFNDIYAIRFAKLRGIMSKPLMNYEFVVEPKYSKAGNDSVILRRISPAQLSKGAAKK